MVHATSLLPLALLAISGAAFELLPKLRANKVMEVEQAMRNPERVAAANQAFLADHVSNEKAEIEQHKSQIVAKHAAGLKTRAMDGTSVKGAGRALMEASTGAYHYKEHYDNSTCGSVDYITVQLESGTGVTGECLVASQSIAYEFQQTSGYLFCNENAYGASLYAPSVDCGGEPFESFEHTAKYHYDNCTNGTKFQCGTPSSNYLSIGYTTYAGTNAAEACNSYNNFLTSRAYSDECRYFGTQDGTRYHQQYTCGPEGIGESLYKGDCTAENLISSSMIISQPADSCKLEYEIAGGAYSVTSEVTCNGNYFSQTGGGGGGDDDDVCFSGDSTVELESGQHKTMQMLEVGDRVLTADANGKLSFSEVVFLPHGPNEKDAIFVQLTLSEGQALKATPKHLLRTCGGSLAAAGELDIGACLETKSGAATVASKTYVRSATGIYTAVTNNEFLVVEGVVASPFAISHAVPHAFYQIHRALYATVPSVLSSPLAAIANAFFGSMAVVLHKSATSTLK